MALREITSADSNYQEYRGKAEAALKQAQASHDDLRRGKVVQTTVGGNSFDVVYPNDGRNGPPLMYFGGPKKGVFYHQGARTGKTVPLSGTGFSVLVEPPSNDWRRKFFSHQIGTLETDCRIRPNPDYKDGSDKPKTIRTKCTIPNLEVSIHLYHGPNIREFSIDQVYRSLVGLNTRALGRRSLNVKDPFYNCLGLAVVLSDFNEDGMLDAALLTATNTSANKAQIFLGDNSEGALDSLPGSRMSLEPGLCTERMPQ